MARIGLKNFRYAKLTEEDGTAKYDGAKSLGKAVDCKVTIENNSAELYADDMLVESDTSFKKGTVAITIDEDSDTIIASLMGQTISATSGENAGEIIRTVNDAAPYVGIGRILTKLVSGVRKYKVEFLCKVKFHYTMPDEKTKGDSLEFATPSLEGDVAALADGVWSKSKTFDNYEAASTYLDSLMAAKA